MKAIVKFDDDVYIVGYDLHTDMLDFEDCMSQINSDRYADECYSKSEVGDNIEIVCILSNSAGCYYLQTIKNY